jgi:type II secretory pathway component PulK
MRRCRGNESGYALLTVFLIAAALAISLYSEIPRVALQSQRHKEQLLMERGEQYQRAIRMYVETNRAYPRSLDDLDASSGRHYLRHRYIDPMTGKDEWRFIHVQGNVVIDSIQSKQQTETAANTKVESSYIGAHDGLGEAYTSQSASRAQERRRASETPESQLAFPAGSEGAQENPSSSAPQTALAPQSATNPLGLVNSPGTMMPQPISTVNPTLTAQPSLGTTVGQSAASGQTPGAASAASAATPGAVQASPTAASLINDMLTRPNPQGALAVQQNLQGGAAGNALGALVYSVPAKSSSGGVTSGTGLIAGVASTSEAEAVMVLNDYTAYNQWEFIYDSSKTVSVPAFSAAQAQGGTQGSSFGPSGTMAGGAGGRNGTGSGSFGGTAAGQSTFGLSGSSGRAGQSGTTGTGGSGRGAQSGSGAGQFSGGGMAVMQGMQNSGGLQSGATGTQSAGTIPGTRLGRP